MEALDICAGHVKAEEVVTNKLMERLQQERSSAQRCAVYGFSLLMAHGFLYDLYNELGILRFKFKLRIFQVSEETVDSLSQLLASDFLSAPDRFAVLKNCRPVLAVNLLQVSSMPQRGRSFFLRQERNYQPFF